MLLTKHTEKGAVVGKPTESRGIYGKSSLLDLGSLFSQYNTGSYLFVLLGKELGRDSMEKPGQVTAILGIWDREVCSMFYKLGSFKHPSSQILASGWGLARRELEQ